MKIILKIFLVVFLVFMSILTALVFTEDVNRQQKVD